MRLKRHVGKRDAQGRVWTKAQRAKAVRVLRETARNRKRGIGPCVLCEAYPSMRFGKCSTCPIERVFGRGCHEVADLALNCDLGDYGNLPIALSASASPIS
jgi:hypothetical protein